MTCSPREFGTLPRTRVVPLCVGLAVLFILFVGGTELAQAQMRPAEINKNAQVPTQVPKEGLRPKSTCAVAQLPPNSAVVCNFGTVALSVSYWDGESAWQTISISSGQQAVVVCIKCAQQIDLSFHDGRVARQIALAVGSTYELYWAASGSWDIRASIPGLFGPASAPTAASQ